MSNPSAWNGQFARFDLVARRDDRSRSVISVGDIEIGGGKLVVMAGPCAVESERQLLKTAEVVAEAGARILRAYKPRSSPYSFQGLGIEGLKILTKARQVTGLAVVTEVISPEDVELVAEHADIVQVGTRSMENFALLEALERPAHAVIVTMTVDLTMGQAA